MTLAQGLDSHPVSELRRPLLRLRPCMARVGELIFFDPRSCKVSSRPGMCMEVKAILDDSSHNSSCWHSYFGRLAFRCALQGCNSQLEFCEADWRGVPKLLTALSRDDLAWSAYEPVRMQTTRNKVTPNVHGMAMHAERTPSLFWLLDRHATACYAGPKDTMGSHLQACEGRLRACQLGPAVAARLFQPSVPCDIPWPSWEANRTDLTRES